MSAETLDTDAWLKSTLATATPVSSIVGGGIWSSYLPEGEATPAVVYRYLSGPDTAGIGATRVLTTLLYLIEGVVLGDDLATLRALSNAIDGALQGATGTTAAIQVYGVTREQTFSQSEQAPGGAYYHRDGGEYRIIVRPL